MSKVRLILFTRYPVPGQCKTRMIPVLGEQGAADLQEQMTKHQMKTFGLLSESHGFSSEVRYTGSEASEMAAMFGSARYVFQGEGDLGQRMRNAIKDALAEGFQRVVIVGADCPEVDVRCVLEAVKALDEHDVCLGPAEDGGYYLIAMKSDEPAMFTGIKWGGEQVLEQSLSNAGEAGLSVHLLDVRHDVDLPEDLKYWEAVKGRY